MDTPGALLLMVLGWPIVLLFVAWIWWTGVKARQIRHQLWQDAEIHRIRLALERLSPPPGQAAAVPMETPANQQPFWPQS